MGELNASKSPWTARAVFALLLLFFAASGCAALIYEVVWLQLLQLVIGSSAVSLAVLLGTYMGGLCLGSLLLPKLISRQRNPLRVYAVLEAGIGALGILVLLSLPFLARFYLAIAGHGFGAILIRGVVAAACLMPCTLLMGATLPAISRWIESTPQGVSRLGLLYAANIAGAVFGCLLGGFYLLRAHDMTFATYVAASINAIVAAAAWALAPQSQPKSEFKDGDRVLVQDQEHRQEAPPGTAPGVGLIYGTIALSGFCALGAELVWTRLLSLLLGPTVYTFSIILAVFLVGLAIGSAWGSVVARRTRQPRVALGWCQVLVMAAVAWSAWMLARSLPYWPINPSLSRSPWFSFQLDLVRCCWSILPATILWGASFPLALASSASWTDSDLGKLVGKIYAANTVGAILGAVGTSLFFIPWLGTQRAQQLIIGASAVGALFMWIPPLKGSDRISATRPAKRMALCGAVAGVVGLAIVLVWSLPETPWRLIAHGRYLPTYADDRKLLFAGEGMNASVAVTEMSGGIRNFHISGKVEASSDPRDMRMQRMLGHLPGLLHPKPRSVLVVGCGAGVTAGSFIPYPEVERVVICEIEPLIPKTVAPFFHKENHDVLSDPRVEVVYDDARNFIYTTKEKFDIITSDPIHPWVKGAATLYTREYFETCREHLNPGGLVAAWIPLYESDSQSVKSELATFCGVFPEATLWSNDEGGQGYDAVILGGREAIHVDIDALQARMTQHSGIGQSLQDVGFRSAIGLLATYTGRGPDLHAWLQPAEINRDRNLRLQFLAGRSANFYQETAIYQEMVFYRRFPENLFSGSAESLQALRDTLRHKRAAP